MLVGIVSAKGAPGVTTLALALASVSGGVAVELDPSGGSVECWLGPCGEPGLVSAVRRTRAGWPLSSLVVEPVPGCRVLVAPTAGSLAESTIAEAEGRWSATLGEVPGMVWVDAGRWAGSQRTAGRIVGLDAVLMVCPPTIEGVEAARWLVPPLRSIGARVELVVVDDRPYGPAEAASAAGVPLAGCVAWDRKGVSSLFQSGDRGFWRRSSLARSASQVVARLGSRAEAARG